MITPNEKEGRFALADQDSTVTSLSDSLIDKTNCKYLIMKLSERGVFCMEKLTKKNKVFFALDLFADKVVDPVGAGDALLAYSTLSFLVSKSILISSILGSIAAGCECSYDGNIPVRSSVVLDKISQLENRLRLVNLKTLIVGLGNQGLKRKEYLNKDFVGSVDPLNKKAEFKNIKNVDLSLYNSVLLCVPDSEKLELIRYCLKNRKHVLVEKPLFIKLTDLKEIYKISKKNNTVLYTAYNHRFEPHFKNVKKNFLTNNSLGRFYF